MLLSASDRDSVRLNEFVRSLEEHPKFRQAGIADEIVVSSDGKSYVFTAKRLTDDTIVAFVSTVSKESADSQVKSNVELHESIGVRETVKKRIAELESYQHSTKDRLADHFLSRQRWLSQQLPPVHLSTDGGM